MRLLFCCLLLIGVAGPSSAAEKATYLLAADLSKGDTSSVYVTLEVGGDMLVSDETGEKKFPLTVSGEQRYAEQLLAWSADSAVVTRSLRDYQSATAKIQVDEGGLLRELPAAKRLIVTEIRDGRAAIVGNDVPLTRDQYDLVNVVGNSLALNRLLPGREMGEGDSWDHEASTIGALLGMDHVAVCEVQSVVTGTKHQQVQIRLAGTVHGTIDGAPTEIQLRAAYLFHQQLKRITKLNMAIKELRTASQIVPGLDVVAKVSVAVSPSKQQKLKGFTDHARDLSAPLADTLLYESREEGYRFFHDRAWYITDEQSERVSLRCLQRGNLTAHCNITTLPARSAGRETTLEQFERDVRQTLADFLESVTVSTQWTTSQGHECLGVIAVGKVKDVPIEWRYYLIAAPDLPRVSIAVTVEHSSIEQFDDADRQIVDSLELLEKSRTAANNKRKQVE